MEALPVHRADEVLHNKSQKKTTQLHDDLYVTADVHVAM